MRAASAESDEGGAEHLTEPGTGPENAPDTTGSGEGSGAGNGKGKEGGTQRTRPTVVCAECKRQKTKCDRKTPCQGCVKRGSEDRCVYSAAGAEKVDVHSLNNRVMDLEVQQGLASRGIPAIFVPSFQPSAQLIEEKAAAYDEAGGVRYDPVMLQLGHMVPSQPLPQGASSPPAPQKQFLSGLNDAGHGFLHSVLADGGVATQDLQCSHCGPDDCRVEEVKVKEESGCDQGDGDVAMHMTELPPLIDVSMASVPDEGNAGASGSAPRAGSNAVLNISTTLLQSATPYLPSESIYFPEPQAQPRSKTLFYESNPGDLHAYGPSGPETAEPAPFRPSSLKPALTQGLAESLPTSTVCNQLMSDAKDVTVLSPVELGFPSRSSAYPDALKTKLHHASKPLVFNALIKRANRVFSLQSTGTHVSTSPAPSNVDTRPKPGTEMTGGSSKSPTSSRSIAPQPSTKVKPNKEQGAEPPGNRLISAAKARQNAQLPNTRPISPTSTKGYPSSGRAPRAQAPSESSSSTSASSVDETLPFFAVMAATMAIGALATQIRRNKPVHPKNKASPSYLYGLSQQALKVWVENGEALPLSADTSSVKYKTVVKEAHADYLRASLLGVLYLLVSGSSQVTASPVAPPCTAPQHPFKSELIRLIGQIVAQLRVWRYQEGLFSPAPPPVSDSVVPEALAESINLEEGEEMRRRLFWEVIYYDWIIADMFHIEPVMPPSCFTTALPTLAPNYESWVQGLGDESSDVVLEQGKSAKKKGAQEKREMESERLRIERMFFGMRARYSGLIRRVTERISEGGYLIAHAMALESELPALEAALSSELRWAFKHGASNTSANLIAMGVRIWSDTDGAPAEGPVELPATPQKKTTKGKGKGKPRDDNGSARAKSSRLSVEEEDGEDVQLIGTAQEIASAKVRTRILSCELALMAQLLIFKIYSPFSRPLSPAPASTTSRKPATPVDTALERVLGASKALIRIGRVLHQLLDTSPSSNSSPIVASCFKPSLLTMYPLDQLILDATIICARECFGGSSVPSKADKKGMKRNNPGINEAMQSIAIGLDVLESSYAMKSRSSVPPDMPADFSPVPVKEKVIESLRKMLVAKNSDFASKHKLKRTRSSMENDSRREPSGEQVGAGDVVAVAADAIPADPLPSLEGTSPERRRSTTSPTLNPPASETIATPNPPKPAPSSKKEPRIYVRARTTTEPAKPKKVSPPVPPLLTSHPRTLQPDGKHHPVDVHEIVQARAQAGSSAPYHPPSHHSPVHPTPTPHPISEPSSSGYEGMSMMEGQLTFPGPSSADPRIHAYAGYHPTDLSYASGYNLPMDQVASAPATFSDFGIGTQGLGGGEPYPQRHTFPAFGPRTQPSTPPTPAQMPSQEYYPQPVRQRTDSSGYSGDTYMYVPTAVGYMKPEDHSAYNMPHLPLPHLPQQQQQPVFANPTMPNVAAPSTWEGHGSQMQSEHQAYPPWPPQNPDQW